VKYVYKIHSGYDGFTPKRIPERMAGKTLRLGWKRYVDAVEAGDEIWIYFHGPHAFENGVYAKGIAEDVLYDELAVLLRVTEYTTREPLTDAELSTRIGAVVSTRYQQVFVLPEELDAAPVCTVTTTAASCQLRRCASCPTWKSLPTVNRRILKTPHRLTGKIDRFAPGFWVIPNRSFLYRADRAIRRGVRRSSELFSRFKMGEEALAFPLALAMHRALAKAHRLDFDVIVPVPLSPDKAKKNELHRTLVLGKELARLTGAPVREWLTLAAPVSKRRLRTGQGYSASAFEHAYATVLEADPRLASTPTVLLVDDVCTEGSTLRVCADAIRSANPAVTVVATTAGQMTVRQAVADASSLWE